MRKVLSELNIGDKFEFGGLPYLVIDMDLNNMTLHTDYSDLRCVLSLLSFKVVCFDKNARVDFCEEGIKI
jgi:hypothetical protein